MTLAMTGTAANIMVQEKGYYGADDGIADYTKGKTTTVTTNDIVSAHDTEHFTVQPGEVTPPTPPTSGGGSDDTLWPNILQHPQSVSAPAGSLSTFSVVANGGPLSYQWQVDRRDGKGFVSIPGATGATLTVGPVTGAENGYQYRCAVTLYGATMYSGAGQLFVTAGMIPKTGDMPGSPALLLALAGLGLAAWVVARRRAG
ncbi:MAG: immunoglobulin domain-containing protein [Christensenellales bacterium]|nr:immunoglobulin domain-containing protein [Christensenellales bacterium]